jgi:hypothetical protein
MKGDGMTSHCWDLFGNRLKIKEKDLEKFDAKIKRLRKIQVSNSCCISHLTAFES